MKTLVFALIAAVAVTSVTAAEKNSTEKTGAAQLTEAEKAAKKEAARKRMLERTGGIIEKEGNGRIVAINCQKKIPTEAIKARADLFQHSLRVRFDVEEGAWKFGDTKPKNASSVLFIVDDPNLPMSLYAPEAQWGVLNVSKIDAGARFNKAFARALVHAFGAGVSQLKNSPMQTVTCPDDLDNIMSQGMTMDAYSSILLNLQKLGVTQSKKTSYRKACEEGWANTPTNDYQKVVWEEVHAKPTNPMKIKFDPKKGE